MTKSRELMHDVRTIAKQQHRKFTELDFRCCYKTQKPTMQGDRQAYLLA